VQVDQPLHLNRAGAHGMPLRHAVHRQRVANKARYQYAVAPCVVCSVAVFRMAMIAAFESPASAAMVAGAVNPPELSRARN
jgi:hypothetical protein